MSDEWLKCYLVKKQLPSQDEPIWLLTTSNTRSVVLFGETDTGLNLSTFVPGQMKGKSHTIYLNDVSDTTAKNYIAKNGGSNQFYMKVPQNASEPASVVTIAEFQGNEEQPEEQTSEQPFVGQ
tara:strand:- start:1078 stop:1446 length:369 start_codon:yes stop_codon:yes gene_type:complete